MTFEVAIGLPSTRLAIDIGRHRSTPTRRPRFRWTPDEPSGVSARGRQVPRVPSDADLDRGLCRATAPAVVVRASRRWSTAVRSAKATQEPAVTVLADVFCDGHDRAAAGSGASVITAGGSPDAAARQRPVPATFVPDQLGRWRYQVHGWLDPPARGATGWS
jgi:hypothetical protein